MIRSNSNNNSGISSPCRPDRIAWESHESRVICKIIMYFGSGETDPFHWTSLKNPAVGTKSGVVHIPSDVKSYVIQFFTYARERILPIRYQGDEDDFNSRHEVCFAGPNGRDLHIDLEEFFTPRVVSIYNAADPQEEKEKWINPHTQPGLKVAGKTLPTPLPFKDPFLVKVCEEMAEIHTIADNDEVKRRDRLHSVLVSIREDLLLRVQKAIESMQRIKGNAKIRKILLCVAKALSVGSSIAGIALMFSPASPAAPILMLVGGAIGAAAFGAEKLSAIRITSQTRAVFAELHSDVSVHADIVASFPELSGGISTSSSCSSTSPISSCENDFAPVATTPMTPIPRASSTTTATPTEFDGDKKGAPRGETATKAMKAGKATTAVVGVVEGVSQLGAPATTVDNLTVAGQTAGAISKELQAAVNLFGLVCGAIGTVLGIVDLGYTCFSTHPSVKAINTMLPRLFKLQSELQQTSVEYIQTERDIMILLGLQNGGEEEEELDNDEEEGSWKGSGSADYVYKSDRGDRL